MSNGFVTALLVAAASLASARGPAQGATAASPGASASPRPPAPSASVERSIEDLNLIGSAVTMPPFSDTVFGTDTGFRRALFGRGMVLRVNVVPRYTLNLLAAPAPAGQQVYIGHRPTFISGVNPISSTRA